MTVGYFMAFQSANIGCCTSKVHWESGLFRKQNKTKQKNNPKKKKKQEVVDNLSVCVLNIEFV